VEECESVMGIDESKEEGLVLELGYLNAAGKRKSV
jgi:hypothetical protein